MEAEIRRQFARLIQYGVKSTEMAAQRNPWLSERKNDTSKEQGAQDGKKVATIAW